MVNDFCTITLDQVFSKFRAKSLRQRQPVGPRLSRLRPPFPLPLVHPLRVEALPVGKGLLARGDGRLEEGWMFKEKAPSHNHDGDYDEAEDKEPD